MRIAKFFETGIIAGPKGLHYYWWITTHLAQEVFQHFYQLNVDLFLVQQSLKFIAQEADWSFCSKDIWWIESKLSWMRWSVKFSQWLFGLFPAIMVAGKCHYCCSDISFSLYPFWRTLLKELQNTTSLNTYMILIHFSDSKYSRRKLRRSPSSFQFISSNY